MDNLPNCKTRPLLKLGSKLPEEVNFKTNTSSSPAFGSPKELLVRPARKTPPEESNLAAEINSSPPAFNPKLLKPSWLIFRIVPVSRGTKILPLSSPPVTPSGSLLCITYFMMSDSVIP